MASTAGREGIYRDEKTGEYFLPATQRPDGTWRKPRKVKDGYIPQEEVPVYENKGVQWLKSRSDLPPGLNPADVQKDKKDEKPVSKSAKKNAKRKENKEKKKQSDANADKVTKLLADTNISNDQSAASVKTENSEESNVMDKAAIEKKLRNLKKKLRQIEDLEAKIESGEIAKPEKEQLEKVAKKDLLKNEIEDLELDLVD